MVCGGLILQGETSLMKLIYNVDHFSIYYTQCFLQFFFFKWLHPRHMEVPGPGTESEPQVQPTPDPLTICTRLGIKPSALQQLELLQLDA